MAGMKRQREYKEKTENLDLAISLMLLSQQPQALIKTLKTSSSPPQEFECKTCNRKFSSFQALGGHRASHKKPKLHEEDESSEDKINNHTKKAKLHECSICGQEFALGQALGGHMRKHRAAMNDDAFHEAVAKVPVLKRSNSKRIVCLLDLNLTPLENDLKLLFGNNAPQLNLSLC